MSSQAAARQVRTILLGTAFLAMVLALLGATVPADWDAVVERMEVLPGAVLCGGCSGQPWPWWPAFFEKIREEPTIEEPLSKEEILARSQQENKNGDETEKTVRIQGESFSLLFVFLIGIVLLVWKRFIICRMRTCWPCSGCPAWPTGSTG